MEGRTEVEAFDDGNTTAFLSGDDGLTPKPIDRCQNSKRRWCDDHLRIRDHWKNGYAEPLSSQSMSNQIPTQPGFIFVMTYHLDPNLTDLSFLKKRLESTDLIPSQEPLLDGIDEKILSLQKNGINTFNDLLVGLKTANSLSSISKNTGINPDYLSLLRRVVSGFFAKPRPLKDIDWLDQEAVVKLNMIGVKDTKQFYEAVSADGPDLARKSGMTPQVMMRLMEVSDLCRIQWVSPTFARVLAVAGFTSAEKVAQANPEALYEAVIKANEGARYYKGKVGLRDIKRLVVAASYVPQSD